MLQTELLKQLTVSTVLNNQKWSFNGNLIISENGKCLDIHADDFKKNGGKVQLWDCWGNDNQLWSH